MKEYKIIKKGFWKNDSDLEDRLNKYARDGWEIDSAIGDMEGNFKRIIFVRDRYRND
jgi:hypothetical protein